MSNNLGQIQCQRKPTNMQDITNTPEAEPVVQQQEEYEYKKAIDMPVDEKLTRAMSIDNHCEDAGIECVSVPLDTLLRVEAALECYSKQTRAELEKCKRIVIETDVLRSEITAVLDR